MPASFIRTFTDPDQVEDLLRRRTSHVRFTMTGAGNYRADITGIDLHCVRLNRVRVNLPHIMHSTILRDHVLVGFVAAGSLDFMNGVEARPGEMFIGPPCAEHHTQFQADSEWGCLFISTDDLMAASHALIGRELDPPRDWKLMRAEPEAMARLMKVHQSACVLARHTPDILARPGVARAMEQKLIAATIRCLTVMQLFEEVNRGRYRH